MKNTMKKIGLIFTLMIISVMFVLSANALEETGKCGNYAQWTFNNETGELIISGYGSINGNFNSIISNSDIKSVIIEDGIEQIGGYTFKNCKNLTSITIPNSVTHIWAEAFYDCVSLTNINIPNGVTYIAQKVFYNCTSLESIILPDNIETIREYAFYNTGYYNNSSNWENGVLYIGKYLIRANNSLTGKCEIKYGTTYICESSFYFCTKLTDIIIPNTVTKIENDAFRDCKNLRSVHIPNSVTYIGWCAFYGCLKLTTVNIPGSVKAINNPAFPECDKLENITVDISNTEYSSDDNGVLFNKDKTILMQYPKGNPRESYIIPDGVLSICEDAFENSNLTSITIPNSMKSIGYQAFSGYFKDVYYKGTQEQWKKIRIGEDNYALTDATIHFLGKEEHKHNYNSDVTPATCTANGYTTYTCECNDSYIADYTDILAHADNDNNFECDYGCGYIFEKPIDSPSEESVKNCSCNCHKGGIAGFIFKLTNFFKKLFGINRICACGVKH